ncbi:MAG: hypothetical protein Q8Q97_00410 [bacterium]|nr:hypothetical protein [bacterium]
MARKRVDVWMDPDDETPTLFVTISEFMSPEQYQWVIRRVSGTHEIERGVGEMRDHRPAFRLQLAQLPKEIGDIALAEIRELFKEIGVPISYRAEGDILRFAETARKREVARVRLSARKDIFERVSLVV